MAKENQPFSIQKRLKSFNYAIQGLKTLFREEHNARIHLAVTLIVITLGLAFEISFNEWIVLCLAIGLVFVCEIFNSAIENICDFISPDYNIYIKKAKDLGAAATLVSAGIAVVIGLFVFIPKFYHLLF